MISIILPIYNVEKFIGDCLSSIIKQTYKDYELLLVNDGTPDNSIEVATQLIHKVGISYKVINQVNKGVSAARNTGFKHAQGEYVVMVDPDDILHPSFLDRLVRAKKLIGQNGVVFCGFKVVSEQDKYNDINYDRGISVMSKSQAQEHFLDRSIRFLLPTLFANRDFLIDHNIFFDEDVQYSEDVLYIWKVLAYTKEVAYIDCDLYNYYLHGNSTMTASGLHKMITGFFGVERLYKDFIEDNENCTERVRQQLVPRWKFAAIHGAAKILDFYTYGCLLRQTGFKGLVPLLKKSGSTKIKTITMVMNMCPLFGYLLMRKF